jgi:hypothetical protein
VPAQAKPEEMPWVQVSKDKKGFVLDPSSRPFVPWGFNYDHDDKGRLIEDYWEDEWPTVEAHFGQMKKLGANVVRVHLQLGKFMDGPEKPNKKALDRLGKLLRLAERLRLYLDLTGLGRYHKKDVPAWYDKLSEKERWAVQARFWQAVTGRCAASPAVFCYDLMNEPVVPGGRRKDGDWLGPPFAGKHFLQFITLDQADRPRPDIARQWVHHLAAAIREKDKRHLITVGLVDWSLDRKGLTLGHGDRAGWQGGRETVGRAVSADHRAVMQSKPSRMTAVSKSLHSGTGDMTWRSESSEFCSPRTSAPIQPPPRNMPANWLRGLMRNCICFTPWKSIYPPRQTFLWASTFQDTSKSPGRRRKNSWPAFLIRSGRQVERFSKLWLRGRRKWKSSATPASMILI